MPSLTVRSKLTLITVGALAVLYVLLGLVVQVIAREAIMSSIDAELVKQGNHLLDEHQWIESHRPPDHDPRDGHRDGPGGPHGPPMWFRRQGPGPRMVWAAEGASLPPLPREAPYDVAPIHAARLGKTRLTTTLLSGEPVRIYTVPITGSDGHSIEGIVQFPYTLGDTDQTLAGLNKAQLIILPFGLILMAGASLFIVGRTMRPIRTITEASAKIEADDLSGRLTVLGHDEFAVLARTVNGMLERLEGSFKLQQSTLRQLEALVQQQRRFTADASHELKTPLTVIKAHVGLLSGAQKNSADTAESVQAIDEAASKMSRLIQDLLLLARTDAGQLMQRTEPCDLRQIAAQAVVNVVCGSKSQLELDDEPVMVEGLPFALERLLSNLLENACRHSAEDGKVVVSVHRVGAEAVVEVADNGEGIAPDHLGHIFDRFYRVDTSRNSLQGGSGLGLAICKGIVAAHGGQITVESELGRGTKFRIGLPSL